MASRVDNQVCSVAQRCLWIAELARQVVQHAAHNSMKDVVALSTTCLSTHDSAQDEIWGSLTDLRNLVKCFPDDVWEETLIPVSDGHDSAMLHNVVLPKRAPRANEWKRFLANAARVKSFVGCESNGTPRTLQYWGLFLAVYRPVLDIFPNIQRLECRDNFYQEAPVFANLFVGDKLRTFVLAWLPGQGHLDFDEYDTAGDVSLITCLTRKAARSLREFRLIHNDIDIHKDPDLNDAIRMLVSASHLEIFESNLEISLSDLTQLAQVYTMKQLEVTLSMVEPNPLNVEPGHLPSIPVSGGSLDIRTRIHNTITVPIDMNSRQLTQSLTIEPAPPALEVLTIRRVARKHEFNSERVRSILETVAANLRAPSSLRKFAFLPPARSVSMTARAHHPQRPWPEFKINRDIYKPLLGMKALTHLNIANNYLDLNDRDIHDLISHLPHLESLLLLPEFYHSDRSPPKVTMDSLWCVAHYASNLRELGLAVNFAADYPRRAIERRNMTCRRLDFADSFLPQGRVDELAKYLHSLFRHPEFSIDALRNNYCVDLQFLADNDVIAEKQFWRTCSERLHSLASQPEPNVQD